MRAAAFGFRLGFSLAARRVGAGGGAPAYTPALKFNDARNSQFRPLLQILSA